MRTKTSTFGRNHSPSLLTPLRHPVIFLCIFLPVIASIVAGSIIYEFSYFYLLIPGFWCYGVGCFLINGFAKGSLKDNQGNAILASNPLRFWSKAALWIAAYIFAMVYPLGYGIQEKGKMASARTSMRP